MKRIRARKAGNTVRAILHPAVPKNPTFPSTSPNPISNPAPPQKKAEIPSTRTSPRQLTFRAPSPSCQQISDLLLHHSPLSPLFEDQQKTTMTVITRSPGASRNTAPELLIRDEALRVDGKGRGGSATKLTLVRKEVREEGVV